MRIEQHNLMNVRMIEGGTKCDVVTYSLALFRIKNESNIFLRDLTLQNTDCCNCRGVTLEDRLRFSIEEEVMVSFEEKHDSECVVLVGVL